MTYISDIKDKLKNNIEMAIQMLLLILGAYIFIMAEKHGLRKAPLLFIGLLSWFFFRNKTKHPIIWFVLFALLVLDLYQFYFGVANHHFLLIFMVLSVLLYRYHKCTEILLKNIQILLVIVVMASALQKLLSDQFMNGDFYYYLINRAFVFDVFHPFFPDVLEVAKDNSESILVLKDTDPNRLQSVVLKDVFPNLGLISLIYAWGTVALEFIVATALLFKPRGTWTHLLFTTMILCILFTRLEMGFMGLLAICGFFLCSNYKLRFLYFLIAMVCITSMVVRLGFH